METKTEKDGVCPHCGYCQHCGRGGQQFVPFYPIYPYPQPWWLNPYQTTWVGDIPTVGTGTATITGGNGPFTSDVTNYPTVVWQ